MGAFYRIRILDLLGDSAPWLIGPTASAEQHLRETNAREQQYRTKLLKNRDKAIELIIEMLRYQNWPLPDHMDNRRRVSDG